MWFMLYVCSYAMHTTGHNIWLKVHLVRYKKPLLAFARTALVRLLGCKLDPGRY